MGEKNKIGIFARLCFIGYTVICSMSLLVVMIYYAFDLSIFSKFHPDMYLASSICACISAVIVLAIGYFLGAKSLYPLGLAVIIFGAIIYNSFYLHETFLPLSVGAVFLGFVVVQALFVCSLINQLRDLKLT